MTSQPLSFEQLIGNRRRLRRELLENPGLRDLRVAVLGGVTTNELVDMLELLLLAAGFRPTFYQSDFGRYFEDAVLEPEKLKVFQPDVVYVQTHWRNLSFPAPHLTGADAEAAKTAALRRFEAVWGGIHAHAGCHVVQNNFETPPVGLLGNLDCVADAGRVRFVWELNLAFSEAARSNRTLSILDVNSLAASMGGAQWHDWTRWHTCKIPTTSEATFALAQAVSASIGAIFGKSRKCLILDLDHTLWGGVIGDDGVDRIQIGKETAIAEAYTAFQQYCLELRARGIVLAVCSKNDDATARAGFSHPDSVLQLEHFAAFKANWQPKHENIQEIARELSLGLDSFVFVDDNPAERALVRAQLPMVLTPEVGSDVTLYPAILHATRCFETVRLSEEDLERSAAYAANTARESTQNQFADYGAYLDFLEMRAEIASFQPVYLDRIAQLINKTNQFNLTTRRYTYAEVEQMASSPAYLTLYGRLSDRFGDNGLISVVIGRQDNTRLHIDLWLMSCRVLKRDMECAMLDALVEAAGARGVGEILGYYCRTPRNGMVEDHYRTLGFEAVPADAEQSHSVWRLPVAGYRPRNSHIAVAPRPVAAATGGN